MFFKEAPCIVIPIECVVSIGGDVILVSIEHNSQMFKHLTILIKSFK